MIEEWVKGKEKAEAIAVEFAKDYIEETPKPIDKSNYLQVRARTRVFSCVHFGWLDHAEIVKLLGREMTFHLVPTRIM